MNKSKLVIPVKTWLIISFFVMLISSIISFPTKHTDTGIPESITAIEMAEEIVTEEPRKISEIELAILTESLQITNKERAKHGLPALETNSIFNSYASDWAFEMSKINQPFQLQYFHSPDFVDNDYEFRSFPVTEPKWMEAFENVGRITNINLLESPEEISQLFYGNETEGFLSSLLHRCSILHPYVSETGIGVYFDESKKQVFITQIFVQYETNNLEFLTECKTES